VDFETANVANRCYQTVTPALTVINQIVIEMTSYTIGRLMLFIQI